MRRAGSVLPRGGTPGLEKCVLKLRTGRLRCSAPTRAGTPPSPAPRSAHTVRIPCQNIHVLWHQRRTTAQPHPSNHPLTQRSTAL